MEVHHDKMIGSGAEGGVFLGCLGNRNVAVKRARSGTTAHEARMLRLCKSAFAVGLLLEVPGASALDLLKPVKGPVEGHVKTHLAELFIGLAYIHQKGVVHRNLKLENILQNSSGHLKLSDFGCAGAHFSTAWGVGSFKSWSPELHVLPCVG